MTNGQRHGLLARVTHFPSRSGIECDSIQIGFQLRSHFVRQPPRQLPRLVACDHQAGIHHDERVFVGIEYARQEGRRCRRFAPFQVPSCRDQPLLHLPIHHEPQAAQPVRISRRLVARNRSRLRPVRFRKSHRRGCAENEDHKNAQPRPREPHRSHFLPAWTLHQQLAFPTSKPVFKQCRRDRQKSDLGEPGGVSPRICSCNRKSPGAYADRPTFAADSHPAVWTQQPATARFGRSGRKPISRPVFH